MRNQANQQNYSTTPKTWSQQDMENALNALRNHNMSLTKVCLIPIYLVNIFIEMFISL